jgi:hypothetical protein
VSTYAALAGARASAFFCNSNASSRLRRDREQSHAMLLYALAFAAASSRGTSPRRAVRCWSNTTLRLLAAALRVEPRDDVDGGVDIPRRELLDAGDRLLIEDRVRLAALDPPPPPEQLFVDRRIAAGQAQLLLPFEHVDGESVVVEQLGDSVAVVDRRPNFGVSAGSSSASICA